MKDRIRAIMDMYQMTQQTFAQKLGLAPATISSIFTGRTNPTNNHIQAIHKSFPQVSTNWVLFGEGEMLINTEVSNPITIENDCNQNFGDIEKSLDTIDLTLFDTPSPPPQAAPENISGNSSPSTLFIPSPKKADASSDRPNTNDPNTLLQTLLSLQNDMSKNKEKEYRKIKEIRVFFDDGTFEAFSPLK